MWCGPGECRGSSRLHERGGGGKFRSGLGYTAYPCDKCARICVCSSRYAEITICLKLSDRRFGAGAEETRNGITREEPLGDEEALETLHLRPTGPARECGRDSGALGRRSVRDGRQQERREERGGEEREEDVNGGA